ncbi:ABC transporter ATP-binding protein, partial [bacterium]
RERRRTRCRAGRARAVGSGASGADAKSAGRARPARHLVRRRSRCGRRDLHGSVAPRRARNASARPVVRLLHRAADARARSRWRTAGADPRRLGGVRADARRHRSRAQHRAESLRGLRDVAVAARLARRQELGARLARVAVHARRLRAARLDRTIARRARARRAAGRESRSRPLAPATARHRRHRSRGRRRHVGHRRDRIHRSRRASSGPTRGALRTPARAVARDAVRCGAAARRRPVDPPVAARPGTEARRRHRSGGRAVLHRARAAPEADRAVIRLEAENLGFVIDGHAIVREVSFAAQGGEFIALIGPNGAGKSTLLKLLAGLATPVGGRVSL